MISEDENSVVVTLGLFKIVLELYSHPQDENKQATRGAGSWNHGGSFIKFETGVSCPVKLMRDGIFVKVSDYGDGRPLGGNFPPFMPRGGILRRRSSHQQKKTHLPALINPHVRIHPPLAHSLFAHVPTRRCHVQMSPPATCSRFFARDSPPPPKNCQIVRDVRGGGINNPARDLGDSLERWRFTVGNEANGKRFSRSQSEQRRSAERGPDSMWDMGVGLWSTLRRGFTSV